MESYQKMLLIWIGEAEGGVDFREGFAACPACGSRLKVKTTRPWDGSTRIRYHACKEDDCMLATIGQAIKSIESRETEEEKTHVEE